MKAKLIKDGRKGLTLIEVLVIIAVIVLLVGLILPTITNTQVGHRAKRDRMSCVNNLKAMALSFRIFANDNDELFPARLPGARGGALEAGLRGDITHLFRVMSNELAVPKTVICPADDRTYATNWTTFHQTNVSYFVGLDGADTRPNTILLGDRDIAENGELLSGAANLTTNRPVAWHTLLHKEGGNIALADGSVQQTTTITLRQLLANTSDATNRVLFPQ